MKKVLLLSVLLVVIISLVGIVAAQDEDYEVLRARNGTDDVPTLDPALATDASSIQVLLLTTPGLTAIQEEDSSAIPGIATSWEEEIHEDGTVTYTFHLVEELPWVYYDTAAGEVKQVLDADGNVRFVTAHDVVYGWKRTINPETGADYAYVLYPNVVGGTEAYEEGGSLDELAIEAVDDYTFVVTAPQKLAFQPAIYGMWIARPMPQWAIEEYGDFWQNPGNNQSYGPYVMSDWVHNEVLTVVKNPFWPGTETIPVPDIEEIQLYNLDESTGMSMFEAGDLDFLDTVNASDLDRIRADAELSQYLTIIPTSCSYYYGFNTRDEPFNNLNLRLAFSYAIDRESIVDNVTRGGQEPAQWFSIPGLAGAPTMDTHPDIGIWYDPDMAKEYLQAYLDEMGYTSIDEIPPITLLYNTSEAHGNIAAAAQQMWLETLGIEVMVTNQEFATYLDSRAGFPIWRAGWCQDYPDAHNFLYDVFHSSSQNNDTWWSNEEFDALLEEAMLLNDNEARQELYAQAEDILVLEEAAIIPFYWYVKINMTAGGIERTYPLDNAEFFYNWTMDSE